MNQEIKLPIGDIMQIGDEIEFFRPGLRPRGNQYAGFIANPRTARKVAYHLLLWADDVEAEMQQKRTAK